MFYFLHSTSVLSFYIDVVLTLSTRPNHHVRIPSIHLLVHWCQKQVSQTWISNCIPQDTVGCNYLSMAKIPAPGTKVLIHIGLAPEGPVIDHCHDDVIKWKYFPRNWPFVRGIHRSPVNSPHKGQWHGALTFSLICTGTNSRANNGDAGVLRRHRAHYFMLLQLCHAAGRCNTHIEDDFVVHRNQSVH